MKKLCLLAVLLMTAGIITAQSLQKGNLVGFHIITLQLKPGVTEDQATKFVLEKMIPADEKAFGTKEYLMRGKRGEYIGKFGVMIVFKDEKDREKFYADNSEAAEAYAQAQASLKEINEEANKLFEVTNDMYDDYLIKVSNGEPIQKGNLIGVHNLSLILMENATEDQYFDYYSRQIESAYEEYEPGCKIFLSKSLRGTNEGKIGGFYIFRDESTRNLYFDENDNMTQRNLDFKKKFQPLTDELSKIGKTEGSYTDWIVL